MKALLVTCGSLALTASVVANAYYQKQQFYPSVVHISKSNTSMAVLYLQAAVLVVLFGKLMNKIFFGQLRAAEMEHLVEMSWYAVTETCLAFTVFREDFSPRFVGLFTILLFLKCFHWLAEDRVDFMERSPVISVLFHARAMSLLLLLAVLDSFFISSAYYSTMKGASVQLVFGFEYAILLTVVLSIVMKYVLHSIHLHSDSPWENKAIYMLYTDLLLGAVKGLLYVMFFVIMIRIHTFPMFAIRPMYLTCRAFKKALNDAIMSRRAIQNMDTLYADATEEDLASGDNVCIICREDMTADCKKLPCNHIFHTACLRSWFQRQQICPTCRMDVLQHPRPLTPAPAPQPVEAMAPAQPPQPAQFAGFGGAGFPGFAWPPQQPGFAAPPAAPGTAAPGTSSSTELPPAAYTMPPPSLMSPFMMPPMPAFSMMQPPLPADNFSGMSDSELLAMEGRERSATVARVQCLQGIQALLDAAVIQMQQYTAVMHTAQGSDMTGLFGAAVTNTTSSTSTQPTARDTAPHSTPHSAPLTSTLPAPYTSPAPAHPVPSTFGQASSSKTEDESSLAETIGSECEGAVGYTPPKEERLPSWAPEEDAEEDINEMRQRRLKRFSQSQSEERDIPLD